MPTSPNMPGSTTAPRKPSLSIWLWQRKIAAAADNGDGTVTIQLYQNLGSHNSTAAWYRVDRVSGQGRDLSADTPIDLTDGSADMDIRHLDPAALLLAPRVPVTNVRVVALAYMEDGSFQVTGELFKVDAMSEEKPLVLRADLDGVIPISAWPTPTATVRSGSTRFPSAAWTARRF